MRIRSIRPEFWSSEDVAAMDWHTRLVFIGLWSYVDDNGVGRDVEALIVAALFPLDGDLSEASVRVHGALKRLSQGGQITRYVTDGKRYLHIRAWSKHQRINRASEGRYPLPEGHSEDAHDILTEPSLSPHAETPLGEGEKGRRGEGEKAASEEPEALDSPPKRRAAKVPIPDDWSPTDQHRAYAAEHRIDINHETERFRNRALAKDERYANWNRAFTNWLANGKANGWAQVLPLTAAERQQRAKPEPEFVPLLTLHQETIQRRKEAR